MFKADVEDEGLDILLIGLKHPAFHGNSLMKALYAALALEWTCRQTEETSEKAVELPQLDKLSDDELKESIGFLYGLCCSIDVGHYRKTFAFCFALLRVLLEEIELRSTNGMTVH
jgi:hypothetical protein